MGITCGYLDVQGVEHSNAYILIRVHLFGCSILFKPLFNQDLHSLFRRGLFAARERTGKTTQTTGDNKIAVVTSKPKQTVDEIHVQQRVRTIGDRWTGDKSPVTGVALFAGMTAAGVHFGVHSRS